MTRKTTRGGHPYPCHCNEVCRPANAAYERARYRLQAYGRWEPYTGAQPPRTHVRHLMEAGIGVPRIAELAGVPYPTLCNLLYGSPSQGVLPPARIRTATAAKILAVSPGETALAPGALVDATGTRRRVQALIALGHSEKTLAPMIPMAPEHLRRIARGHSTVSARTARAVRALYDRMWDQSPPRATAAQRATASKCRARAEGKGWVPPLVWDDDTIDDPSAQPASGWRRSRFRRAEDLAAEAAELAELRYTRTQAAERIGVQRGTLGKALARVAARGRAA